MRIVAVANAKGVTENTNPGAALAVYAARAQCRRTRPRSPADGDTVGATAQLADYERGIPSRIQPFRRGVGHRRRLGVTRHTPKEGRVRTAAASAPTSCWPGSPVVGQFDTTLLSVPPVADKPDTYKGI